MSQGIRGFRKPWRLKQMKYSMLVMSIIVFNLVRRLEDKRFLIHWSLRDVHVNIIKNILYRITSRIFLATLPCHWTLSMTTQNWGHYSDVIMSAMASQINGLSIVYSTVCSGADQRKHQSCASLVFFRGRPSKSALGSWLTRSMLTFHTKNIFWSQIILSRTKFNHFSYAIINN